MNIDTLRRMANQIARNFTAMKPDEAVAATAEHIALFWDPRMKAAILASDRSALSPVAAAAVDRLTPPANAPELRSVNGIGHPDAG